MKPLINITWNKNTVEKDYPSLLVCLNVNLLAFTLAVYNQIFCIKKKIKISHKPTALCVT